MSTLNTFRLLALTATLALAPCGLTAINAAHAADEVTVEITLQDDAFSPAEVKVPAGKPILFKVTNRSAVAAEIEAKDMKIEKVVAPGSDMISHVRAMEPGRYLFVNEYKEDTVKGYLVVE